MGQHIGRPHSSARDMDKMEVKILEEHHPPGLTMAQLLRLVEICKVFMVSKKGDRVASSLEVVVSVVKGMDNGK